MKLSVLIWFVVSLVLAEDFYGSDPHVFELTPATFDKVVNRSNYTTIVEFYAPWCGYCKQLRPIYHKLAKFIFRDSKYAVNVAAVNCDNKANSDICRDNKITGYPSILVFRPPKYDDNSANPTPVKTKHIPETYNGARQFKTMVEFLTSRIKNYVKTFTSVGSDSFNNFLKIDRKYKALLLTESRNLSPMYKSLAIDFLAKIKFGMVSTKDDSVTVKQWNYTVDKLPALLVHNEETGETVSYPGKLNDKLKISEWLVEQTGLNPGEGELSNKNKKHYLYYRLGIKPPKEKKNPVHDEL